MNATVVYQAHGQLTCAHALQPQVVNYSGLDSWPCRVFIQHFITGGVSKNQQRVTHGYTRDLLTSLLS